MHPHIPSYAINTGISDTSSISGPIVVSWWLKPRKSASSTHRSLLGGYHSFSTRPLPPSPSHPDHLRCTFSTHLMVEPAGTSPGTENDRPLSTHRPPTTPNLRGLSMVQNVSMAFHVLYSRLLVDLAARRMGVDVPWW